jgi:hypothetical protein
LSAAAAVLYSKEENGLKGSGVSPAADNRVRTGELFDWVVPVEAPAVTSIKPEEALGGVLYLLIDRQMHAERGECYFHLAGRVLNETGLQQLSLIRLEFDPSFQTPFLHAVDVVRDGRRSSRLRPESIHVMAVEREQERFVYNRAMAAVLHLEDVRVGDTVEYAFSLRGENPVYPGAGWAHLPLGYPFPVGLLHQRLLSSASRPVTLRFLSGAPPPAVREQGGLVERAWRLGELHARTPEDDIPVWCLPFPHVEATEQSSWSEVVDWALGLFPAQSGPDPLLDAQVAALAAQAPTPAERAVAALRFVQGEVRYLAFNEGPSPMQAKLPATVLRQRYGDCKDKSWLLCHLLRALGLDAVPALVNTRLQGHLADLAPSINVFNHCVVRLNLEGAKRWYDPSAPRQGGHYDEVAFPEAQALEVAAGTRELTPVSSVSRFSTHTRESFHWKPGSDAILLEVETSHRGSAADLQRVACGAEGLANLESRFRSFYARLFGQVQRAKPITMSDDLEANLFTLKESYNLADPWRPGGQQPQPPQLQIAAYPLLEQLRVPRVQERTLPFALGPIGETEYEVRLHHDGTLTATAADLAIESAGLRFEKEVKSAGKTVTFRFRLARCRDHVPPEEMPKYLETVQRIRDEAGFVYAKPSPPQRSAGAAFPWWILPLLVLALPALRECLTR